MRVLYITQLILKNFWYFLLFKKKRSHLSHHVITKLGIPYHLPTCHLLSSLARCRWKSKKRTNKLRKLLLLFFLFKAKQKGNFILGETKKEQRSKERSCCFFEAKGKRFFSFRTTQKKDKKTKFLF